MYQQSHPLAILWQNKDCINPQIILNGVYKSLNNNHLNQNILCHPHDDQSTSKSKQVEHIYDLHT